MSDIQNTRMPIDHQHIVHIFSNYEYNSPTQSFGRSGGQHLVSGRIPRQSDAHQVGDTGHHGHADGHLLSAGNGFAGVAAGVGVLRVRAGMSHVAHIHHVQQQYCGHVLFGNSFPARKSQVHAGHGQIGGGAAHVAFGVPSE